MRGSGIKNHQHLIEIWHNAKHPADAPSVIAYPERFSQALAEEADQHVRFMTRLGLVHVCCYGATYTQQFLQSKVDAWVAGGFRVIDLGNKSK